MCCAFCPSVSLPGPGRTGYPAGQLYLPGNTLELGSCEKLIIAYEPVWAIGTGSTAAPHQVQEAHQILRRQLEEVLGPERAHATRILYGGSVKPENISAIMALEDVDGVLVGGASLDPETFEAIIKYS